MEKLFVGIADLFDSLGLPSDAESIAAFVARHAPLNDRIRIEDAPFWSKSQSLLLKDAIQEDGHLTSVVDQLNALMRR